MEATQLLQEWVRDCGSQAGLTAANTRISTGAVGVPESRLEVCCMSRLGVVMSLRACMGMLHYIFLQSLHPQQPSGMTVSGISDCLLVSATVEATQHAW